MIKNTDHCALCDLSEAHLQLGLVCSLTEKVPDFHRTCTKIKLNIVLEDKLDELEEKEEELSFTKFHVIRNLFIYPILGICVLISDYFFYQKFINNYDILSIDNLQNDSPTILISFIIILLFGFGLIGKGIGPYLNYLEDNKMNDVEIDKVYDILELYQVHDKF